MATECSRMSKLYKGTTNVVVERGKKWRKHGRGGGGEETKYRGVNGLANNFLKSRQN